MYNMGIYLDFGHHFSIDGLLLRSKNVDFRQQIFTDDKFYLLV
jgi:hypothetical protein